MKSKLLALAFFAAFTILGADNLAPIITLQKGKECHWIKVNNAAAQGQVQFSLDSKIVPVGAQKSLKIELKSPNGYAEWRIDPLLKLKPGVYTLAAYVKHSLTKAPYLQVYSFDAANKPTMILDVHGKSGHQDWYLLQGQVKVPPDSVKIRVGMGISDTHGAVWFAKPLLVEGKTAVKAPAAALMSGNKNNAPAVDKWIADWIWIKDPKAKIPNVIFSKKIKLRAQPTVAFIQITADNAYELSINGKSIAGDANWKTVETYDIAPYLHPGENEFKLLVMNLDGPGGVVAQGQAWYKDGTTVIIKTDKSWQHSVPKSSIQPALLVLGPPPVMPWNKLPFKNLTPPTNLALTVKAYTAELMPGDVFRITFQLTQNITQNELENLNFLFKHNNIPTVISGYKTIVTPSFDHQTIAVEIPISHYASPGKYSWELHGIATTISAQAGKNTFTILAGKPMPNFKAAKLSQRRANILQTPAGKQAPTTYSTFAPSIEGYVNWQATGSHMYEIYVPIGYWLAEQHWDMQQIDKIFMQILNADQQASVVLKIRVDTPSWWMRQYPDECYISQHGRRGPQSFASDVWRKTVLNGVSALIKTVENRAYGDHLGGIILMAFKGGEWQLWGEAQGEYDCSAAVKKAFLNWQKNKNIKPPMSLPSPALQVPFQIEKGYAAIRKKFFSFIAERQADNIIYFSNQFKALFDNKYEFGVYFGYVMEHAGSKRMLFAGHLGIAKVLAEGNLDIISCPASYALRSMHLSHAYMNPVDSALLHNVVPILENDIRNYKVKDAGDSAGATLPDLYTSINSLNKLDILAAAHGAAMRYFALLYDIDYFQDPAILRDIKWMEKQIMALTPVKVGAPGQIALVLNTMEYCGAGEADYLKLSIDFLSNIRDVLMRTGRPVAFITMQDWLANRKMWQYVVFPLPGLLTTSQRQTITATYGKLPVITSADGALVITPELKVTTSKLHIVRDKLSTPQALKSGYSTIWYIGGNFTATYDTTSQRINIKSTP